MVRVGEVAGLCALGGCARDADPCAIEMPATSIDGVLDRIGDLPAPVTLECVLTALERPIGLELTSDVFNTQPAQGPESPRVLIRSETLTLTVVPVGEAARLLEFGEDHPVDPVRCGMFSALLDHGEVVHRPFADSVGTRFGP